MTARPLNSERIVRETAVRFEFEHDVNGEVVGRQIF